VDIKRIREKYCRQPDAHIVDNVDEMDQLIERYIIPSHRRRERDNMSSHT
jgi:hypothetical protein